MRVGIIRGGAVGSAFALALVMRGAAREVVLVDRTRQRSRAVATDLQYGTPRRHWSISGTAISMISRARRRSLVAAGINEKAGGCHRPQRCRGPADALRLA
jgi:L-lactate dehydrogenase